MTKTSQRPSFCFLESFHDQDQNQNYPLRDNSFQMNVLLVGSKPVRGHLRFKLKCLSEALILRYRRHSVLSLNLKCL